MSRDAMPTGRPLRDWFMNAPTSDVVIAFVEDPSLVDAVRTAIEQPDAPTARKVAGKWHRRKPVRHPKLDLSSSWRHDNGSEIYQGRPYPDEPKRFVYMLVRPDGHTRTYSLLKLAKSGGAAADAAGT